MKRGDIDFANVMNSAFGAKTLFDELKKKYHPDKFATDAFMFEKANKIFGLIIENRYNKAELEKLKVRAEKELTLK